MTGARGCPAGKEARSWPNIPLQLGLTVVSPCDGVEAPDSPCCPKENQTYIESSGFQRLENSTREFCLGESKGMWRALQLPQRKAWRDLRAVVQGGGARSELSRPPRWEGGSWRFTKDRALEVAGQTSAKPGAAQRESRPSSAEAPGASAESCPAHCPRLGGSSRGGWAGSVCTSAGRGNPLQSHPGLRARRMGPGWMQTSPHAGETDGTASRRWQWEPGWVHRPLTRTGRRRGVQGAGGDREKEREKQHPPEHF